MQEGNNEMTKERTGESKWTQQYRKKIAGRAAQANTMS
ncbi:hypothetical protein CHCC20375_1943 [Bacillus licheniformis]|nr:hypothetical protein CHCC20375_1943 [Bacillus licheniformis]